MLDAVVMLDNGNRAAGRVAHDDMVLSSVSMLESVVLQCVSHLREAHIGRSGQEPLNQLLYLGQWPIVPYLVLDVNIGIAVRIRAVLAVALGRSRVLGFGLRMSEGARGRQRRETRALRAGCRHPFPRREWEAGPHSPDSGCISSCRFCRPDAALFVDPRESQRFYALGW